MSSRADRLCTLEFCTQSLTSDCLPSTVIRPMCTGLAALKGSSNMPAHKCPGNKPALKCSSNKPALEYAGQCTCPQRCRSMCLPLRVIRPKCTGLAAVKCPSNMPALKCSGNMPALKCSSNKPALKCSSNKPALECAGQCAYPQRCRSMCLLSRVIRPKCTGLAALKCSSNKPALK
jgi:hypothetical protein